ncbi:hypothetical protein C8A01DRAFT_31501 [Parachaetomium inaequale]|uniref:Uncharacterized protein n=1 Tax=Parachaetomium inaequale TaxID=2588326 RepID=A0AAN6PP83_9PEZI|nr:hypothetical protein C8A01DRAFT_31501 [Parachaetomium inaequale]
MPGDKWKSAPAWRLRKEDPRIDYISALTPKDLKELEFPILHANGHWNRPEAEFLKRSRLHDLFGPKDMVDPAFGFGTFNFRFAGSKPSAVTMRTSLAQKLRGCVNSRQAMTAYRTFLFVWKDAEPKSPLTQDTMANYLKESKSNGTCRVPPMDIHYAFVHTGEGLKGIAYSCLSGTDIPIDLGPAMRGGEDYVTTAQFLARQHNYLNPYGGCSNVWIDHSMNEPTNKPFMVTHWFASGNGKQTRDFQILDKHVVAAYRLEKHAARPDCAKFEQMQSRLDLVRSAVEVAKAQLEAGSNLAMTKPPGVIYTLKMGVGDSSEMRYADLRFDDSVETVEDAPPEALLENASSDEENSVKSADDEGGENESDPDGDDDEGSESKSDDDNQADDEEHLKEMDGEEYILQLEAQVNTFQPPVVDETFDEDLRDCWERDKNRVVRNGVREDIFGPLDDPLGEDSDELTFRYGPADGETCQIQVRHVRLIRGCERLEEAMTAFGIAAWASQFHGKYPVLTLDTAAHYEVDPGSGITEVPTMDVRIGLIDNGEKWNAFLFSTFSGTNMAIDLTLAAKRGAGYITPGRYLLPHHQKYNSVGGRSAYWKDMNIFNNERDICIVTHCLEKKNGEHLYFSLDEAWAAHVEARSRMGHVKIEDTTDLRRVQDQIRNYVHRVKSGYSEPGGRDWRRISVHNGKDGLIRGGEAGLLRRLNGTVGNAIQAAGEVGGAVAAAQEVEPLASTHASAAKDNQARDDIESAELEKQKGEEDLLDQENPFPESFDDIGVDPFASERVVAGVCLLPYGRTKPPPIASIDEALARARYENGYDHEKMKKIAAFIVMFHKGIAKGKQNTFANNNHLRDVRKRCRKALKEYLDTKLVNLELVPSNEEVLAMRYCAPRGELNATIAGLLAEMGMLKLGQATIHSTGQSVAQDKDTANNSNSSLRQGGGEEGGGNQALGAQQEIEVNSEIEASQDVTRLVAQVRALNERLDALIAKNLATIDYTDDLAQKTEIKMAKQEKAVKKNEKDIADLAEKLAVASKKHDDLDEKVAAASKQHAELNKHVKDELASLNAKRALEQKRMEDMAKKPATPTKLANWAPMPFDQLKAGQVPYTGLPRSVLPQPGSPHAGFPHPGLLRSSSPRSSSENPDFAQPVLPQLTSPPSVPSQRVLPQPSSPQPGSSQPGSPQRATPHTAPRRSTSRKSVTPGSAQKREQDDLGRVEAPTTKRRASMPVAQTSSTQSRRQSGQMKDKAQQEKPAPAKPAPAKLAPAKPAPAEPDADDFDFLE